MSRLVTSQIVLLTLVLISAVSLAAEFRSGKDVAVAAGETIQDDLYAVGETITIDGILELEDGGLRVTLIKAVVRATHRAKELVNG